MKDPDQRIAELFIKYLAEDISDTERLELESWRNSNQENKDHFHQWVHSDALIAKMVVFRESDKIKDESRHLINWNTEKTVLNQEAKKGSVYRSMRNRFIAAASVTLIIMSGVIAWHKYRYHEPLNYSISKINSDVPAPTGNNTVLTLSNGSMIVIDSVRVGNLAIQGKTNINKASNGQIVYTSLNGKPSSEVLINTLSTSYGGSSKVVLPDGSTVWLNSLSSLRFPNVFIGKSREVDLTGEAYFEIAQNKNMPFHVKVNGTEIGVLGTHFNVMAYTNEKEQKITLLEGSVRIQHVVGVNTNNGIQQNTNNDKGIVLTPGQQASVVGVDTNNGSQSKTSNDGSTSTKNGLSGAGDGREGAIHVINDEDPDREIAWIKGDFMFKKESIENIMRQLERWYNIEVNFERTPNVHLTAAISKKRSLSEVLNVLKMSGVEFMIEGTKVTVK